MNEGNTKPMGRTGGIYIPLANEAIKTYVDSVYRVELAVVKKKHTLSNQPAIVVSECLNHKRR